jgi:hypothetical protein
MLAALPQHIAELEAVAIGVAASIRLLPILITGRPPQTVSRNSSAPRRTRAIALCLLLVVIGFALTPFFVHAEPRGGAKGGHWGTISDRVIAAVWVTALAAISGYGIWRNRRPKG